MTVRDIRVFGDPVLRTPADPVTTFDKELRNLVRDLTETMHEANGAGLAAPQLGVGLRVFTYDIDGFTGHLINPVLGPFSEEQIELDEGCLSLPGLYFEVARPERVVAVGQNEYGDPVTLEGSGWLSRCLQHETDHLDGIIFIDRMDRKARKDAMRAIRQAEWYDDPMAPKPIIKQSPHPILGPIR